MDNSPSHFFIFPASAPGHTLPAVDLAKLFAARGARVTLILAHHDTSASAAAAVSPLRTAGSPIAVELLPFSADEAGLPAGHDSLDKANSLEEAGKLLQGLQLLKPAFSRLVADLRPDCVVTDTFLPWTVHVAEEFGIPRILFTGTSNFAFSASHAVRKFSPQGRHHLRRRALRHAGPPGRDQDDQGNDTRSIGRSTAAGRAMAEDRGGQR